MRIQDKFDTILKTNKLGIKSIFGLEKFAKVGTGSVSKFLNENESPTIGTIKKIQDALRVNPEWWDTEKGDIYLEKHTSVDKASDNNGKMENPEEVYRNIVEGNTEYILIPRSVLNEKYRLVAIEQIEKDKTQAEKQSKQIDFLIEGQMKLIDKITELQLQPKLAEVQKTQ